MFRTSVEDHFKRNLMIFVTATLIDPSGQKIKQAPSSSDGSDSSGADAALLPSIGN
jgi:general secretion pathway protein D